MGKEYWRAWWKAAGVRAAKTAAEAAIAFIGTGATYFSEINWLHVLEGTIIATLLSFLMSLKGLPELKSHQAQEQAGAIIKTAGGEIDIDDDWSAEDWSDANATGGEGND